MKAPDSILELVEQGMGQELHWFPESTSARLLAETFSGMANADGGRVLLGVHPDPAGSRAYATRKQRSTPCSRPPC